MKRGITVERKYDHNDIPCIVIKKKRGKLALDEIQDILRFEDYQQWNGQYVLFLNCSEATLGGNGCWDLLDEPPGDTVMLYEVAGNEECPVCRSNLPPFSYCPSCGMPWSDSGKSVETLLSSMRQEAARNIRDPKASGASRLAWYWSHNRRHRPGPADGRHHRGSSAGALLRRCGPSSPPIPMGL